MTDTFFPGDVVVIRALHSLWVFPEPEPTNGHLLIEESYRRTLMLVLQTKRAWVQHDGFRQMLFVLIGPKLGWVLGPETVKVE